MWYGNIDTKTKEWAERTANDMEQAKRQKRIAVWIADAALERAKRQAALHAEIKKQREYPRILKTDTIRRRERREQGM